MNVLTGVIAGIESSGEISLVEITVKTDVFSALVLETTQSAPYLARGNAVSILFKETEVAVGKGSPGNISIRNIFACKISGIKIGEVLSDIQLDYHGITLHSIITTKSVKQLVLNEGDTVFGLVKSNEIMLKPV